jgi:hypothetical protein
MVKDPQDRQTGQGYTPDSAIFEIPNAGYGIEGVDNDVTGEEGPVDIDFYLRPILSGNYAITLFGVRSSTFSVMVAARSSDNKDKSPQVNVRKGLIREGRSLEYVLTVDPSPTGQRASLIKTVTPDLLRENLIVAKELGQIKGDGIYNSLSQKVDNAEKQSTKGQKKAAANTLTSFINEVQAQTGKHIDPFAAKVLKEDAEILKKNLE